MKRTVPLVSVCDVVAGQHVPADEHDGSGVGSPYLTGPADFGDTTPSVSKWTRKPRQFGRAGDVFVTVKGAGVGKSNYGIDAAIGRQLMALRPAPSVLDQRYLFFWIRKNERTLNDLGQGATVPGIGKEDLENLPVPLPPLDEQRRIADILDQADALRAKRRAALAQLDTLTQSIFLDMFGDPVTNPKGWPMRRIGDLLSSASYGTSEKAQATGEFPVLRMNNITRTGEMDLTDLKFMDLPENQRERYLVKGGDVLFNRTNSAELVGKTAAVRTLRPMAYAGYLVRLRVNDENHPEYLSAFLNTPYAKAVLRGMCKSIIGMANINAKEVQSIQIAQPTLRTQKAFGKQVEGVEQLKASHRAHLAQLDELFGSLQDRAFRGHL